MCVHCMSVCVYVFIGLCVCDVCEEDSLWASKLLSQCFVKYVTSHIKNVVICVHIF